jgi:glycosyltransferase involved in cell wall biosynthesis
MNIGFIITHISHGSPGSFERIHELSRHLMNLGINSTIITPFVEDKNNVKDVDMQPIGSTTAKVGLLPIAYKIARKMASSSLTSGLFLSNMSITTMVNIIRHGLYSLLKQRRFDILHAVQPIAGLACGPIAKEFKIPFATDLHNIWPEEAVAEGIVKRDDSTFKRLHEVEQSIIDSSNVVTVVSESMRSYIINNYSIMNKPIVVIPPSGAIIAKTSEITREPNVVYAGMVNSREHVDLFAKSIPFLKQPASFFISNYGDAIKDVKKITNNIQQVINYIWFTRRHEVLEFLIKSKIGILTSRNDITRQLGPPLKLFDYMACGLPIVANDIGGWSKMIDSERIGILTRDDPKEFARSIDSILSDDSAWFKMSNKAIELIRKKYNWQNNVQNILIPMYNKLLEH